jgi:aminoglycoside/choline kinase family phosphotransferase
MQEISSEILNRLLKASGRYSASVCKELHQIAGDASTPTVILINHGEIKGPGLAGTAKVSQEEAYQELSAFLPGHGIGVPQLYYHSKGDHLSLVEDVGDLAVWRFMAKDLPDQGEALKDKLGSDWLSELFRRCIDVIALFQGIPRDEKSLAFRRYLAFENYRREISEFLEFYAEPHGIKNSEKEVLNLVFDAICEEISSFPKTLAHFDFNAYNLFVGEAGEMRVLDFQDACLVSPVRDIVSLINDRGMDETLGYGRHGELLEYYSKKLRPGAKFPFQYNTTLLHWDFRVSGRFLKLMQKQNTKRYQQWLPGTLRRLGRTLARCHGGIHRLDDVFEIVTRLSGEAREGAGDSWELPEDL